MPGYRPKKRLGQNFLTDDRIASDMADIIDPHPVDTIIEIGAGRGALTLPLVRSGATVIAVEIDRDLIGYLTKLLRGHDNVTVVNEDFVAFDPGKIGVSRFKLIGNLPFNISSPVIEWVVQHHGKIDIACLMVQKEVAQRLASSPGTKGWSPIAIFTQLYYDLAYHFAVGPRHFRPAPKVSSAVIGLTPRRKVRIKRNLQFQKVVRHAFRQRRKLLVNNLAPELVPDTDAARALLTDLDWPGKIRAEQVSTQMFLQLTEWLARRRMV
ncbi:MAG: ribosomal RNA small subunit methyltransferase A [candidate division Zixibacteria bacterium]|nr:ribosomal RNA small subunit methyltransferase A [candidate division Zixibacteria bacterium]